MEEKENNYFLKLYFKISFYSIILFIFIIPIILLLLWNKSSESFFLRTYLSLEVIALLVLIFISWIGYINGSTNAYFDKIFSKIWTKPKKSKESIEELLSQRKKMKLNGNFNQVIIKNQVGSIIFQVFIISFGLLILIIMLFWGLEILSPINPLMIIVYIFVIYSNIYVILHLTKKTTITIENIRLSFLLTNDRIYNYTDYRFILIRGVNLLIPKRKKKFGLNTFYKYVINPKNYSAKEVVADILMIKGMRLYNTKKENTYIISKYDWEDIVDRIPDFLI